MITKRIFWRVALCISGVISISGIMSAVYAQQDEPKIPKGQLLPVVQVEKSWSGRGLKKQVLSVVFEENFEGNISGWTVSGKWAIGTPNSGPGGCHSPVNCAATGLTENYTDGADDWLISPSITLPTLSTITSQIKLRFWEWFEIESGYDFGKVKISTDGGNTWNELDSRSGNSDWRERVVDISAYAGQSIQIGFHFTSDHSGTFAGWYIDDIQIVTEGLEPLSISILSLNHQRFPSIYLTTIVSLDGQGIANLTKEDFEVYENNVLQTDYDVIPPQQSGGVRLVDIVFLMDNSGSMADEQNEVRNNVIDFVNQLVAGGVDFALGLCRFGSSENGGFPIIEDNGVLTQDPEYFKNDVWTRNITNGGFEPGWDALYEAATSFSFRPGARKVFILITDETPTDDDNIGNYTQAEVIDILKRNTITTFALLDLSDAHAVSDYGVIAEETNGKYFDIYSPLDEILNFISTQVASTYVISYNSSNPVFDGTTREVEVKVRYGGNEASATATYVPGSAPIIKQTPETIDLQRQAWLEGTQFTIKADIIDMVPPGVQQATLYYRTVGDASFTSTPMEPVSQEPDNTLYQGVIPGSDVKYPGVEYYLTASDGQITVSDPSVDPENNAYNIAILPNEPPQITHEPVLYLEQTQIGQPILISAVVEDNTHYVASVWLYYRRIGQLMYQKEAMNLVGGNKYEGIIPADYVTEAGYEYYIEAEDDLGLRGYYGTHDAPIQVIDLLTHIESKEHYIDELLSKGIYVDEEEEAREILNDIKAKLNNGTLIRADVEALIRWKNVERFAFTSYIGAEELIDVMADISEKLLYAIIFVVVSEYGKKVIDEAANIVKNAPVIGGVASDALKGISNTIDSISKSINKYIAKRVAWTINGNIWKDLVLAGLPEEEAKRLAGKVGWNIWKRLRDEYYEMIKNVGFESLLSMLEQQQLNIGVFFVKNKIQDIYEEVTRDKLQKANDLARSRTYGDVPIDEVNKIASDLDMKTLDDLRNTSQLLRNRYNLLEIGTTILILITLLAALATLIVGIIACPKTGGASCILSLISASFSYILTGLSSGKLAEFTTLAILAAVGGMKLYNDVPGRMDNLIQCSFGPSCPELQENFEKQKDHWIVHSDSTLLNQFVVDYQLLGADSLVISIDEVQQLLEQIKAYIEQAEWDSVVALSTQMNEHMKLLDIQLMTYTSALEKYTTFSFDETLKQLYGALSDQIINVTFRLGITMLTVNLAIIIQPSGADLDVVLQHIDNSIADLENLKQIYLQALDYMQSANVEDTPVVTFLDAEVQEVPLGYQVIARIKNVSNVEVYDVAVALRDTLNVIVAETDTVFGVLEPFGEREVRWLVQYFDAYPSTLSFLLEVFSMRSPEEFYGDWHIVTHTIFETPTTPPPLTNEQVYAYPNPCNPFEEICTIRFSLEESAEVSVEIFDVSGTLVVTLLEKIPMKAGRELAVHWDGRDSSGRMVANGVYFYRITTSAGEKAIGKIAIVK